MIANLTRRWWVFLVRGLCGIAIGIVAFTQPFTTLLAFLTSASSVPKGPAPWVNAVAAVTLGLTASSLRPTYRWVRGWTFVALVLILLELAPYPSQPATPPAAKAVAVAADPTSPDVVLVSIDTLRADHLGVYGRSPTLTPEMDRIAREGVVFTRGLASSPWTTPSVASLLTGLPTIRHGAGLPLSAGFTFVRSPLDARFTTLAERRYADLDHVEPIEKIEPKPALLHVELEVAIGGSDDANIGATRSRLAHALELAIL